MAPVAVVLSLVRCVSGCMYRMYLSAHKATKPDLETAWHFSAPPSVRDAVVKGDFDSRISHILSWPSSLRKDTSKTRKKEEERTSASHSASSAFLGHTHLKLSNSFDAEAEIIATPTTLIELDVHRFTQDASPGPLLSSNATSPYEKPHKARLPRVPSVVKHVT